ncbi:MAG: dUTP diphosphatase [Minisyncoccia bacterium]
MQIKIKKLNTNLPTPKQAYVGDAGVDVYASKKTILKPATCVAVPVGIALEIPDGYYAYITDKSGLSITNKIKTMGGVIDSNYRGEIHAGLMNLSDKEYIFEVGDKVAQMIIQKTETVQFLEVEELGESERGEKRFGSSGK